MNQVWYETNPRRISKIVLGYGTSTQPNFPQNIAQDTYICKYCGLKNYINTEKLGVIYILECASCGGELE